eukprot:1950255-Prymnesium_polylepis.1
MTDEAAASLQALERAGSAQINESRAKAGACWRRHQVEAGRVAGVSLGEPGARSGPTLPLQKRAEYDATRAAHHLDNGQPSLHRLQQDMEWSRASREEDAARRSHGESLCEHQSASSCHYTASLYALSLLHVLALLPHPCTAPHLHTRWALNGIPRHERSPQSKGKRLLTTPGRRAERARSGPVDVPVGHSARAPWHPPCPLT